jgi:hypothetical protein
MRTHSNDIEDYSLLTGKVNVGDDDSDLKFTIKILDLIQIGKFKESDNSTILNLQAEI